MGVRVLDLEDFFDAFDRKVVSGLYQLLEADGSCPDLTARVKIIVDKYREMDKDESRAARALRNLAKKYRRKTDKYYDRVADNLKPVSDRCIRCGASMVGTILSPCEQQRSGSFYYGECTRCNTICEKRWRGRNLIQLRWFP